LTDPWIRNVEREERAEKGEQKHQKIAGGKDRSGRACIIDGGRCGLKRRWRYFLKEEGGKRSHRLMLKWVN